VLLRGGALAWGEREPKLRATRTPFGAEKILGNTLDNNARKASRSHLAMVSFNTPPSIDVISARRA